MNEAPTGTTDDGPDGAAALILPAEALHRMIAEARAAYPDECCGLLVGRRDATALRVARVEPSPNVAPPPRHDRFEIDTGLLLRLQRECRARGEAVIGLYHSHPDGAARPSAEDRARAWQPEQVWFILAVTQAGAVETGAWWRGSGEPARFTPLSCRTPADAVP